MPMSVRPFAPVLVVLCLVLAGCSTRVVATNADPTTSAPVALARPGVVVVRNFALDPASIAVDQGVGGRLRRGANGVSASDAQLRDADDIQLALTDTLVKAIRAMGLDAQLDTGHTPPGDAVVIEGQVTSANEGNQTRRTVVGFGAGKSSVTVTAQLLYSRSGAAPQLLQTYQGDSNSGRMPGLAAGAAGAAVTGSAAALAVGAGAHVLTQPRTQVGAEAQRMAKRMSVQIGQFFARQGWIPPSAVPSPL